MSRAPTQAGGPDVAIATVGAAALAALVAIACLVAPARLLEALVVHSGFASLVNAAAPPLGFTARLLVAGAGAVLTGGIGWAVLVLVVGERRVRVRRPAWRMPTLPAMPRLGHRSAPDGQSVRRADSHPDAPPRAPILAERELGTPFLSIVAPAASPAALQAAPILPESAIDERPLPDLDTALADADPGAIPDVPREPVPTVPSLFVPAPPEHSEPVSAEERVADGGAENVEADSIEELLARLERGTRRRPAGPRPVSAVPLTPEQPVVEVAKPEAVATPSAGSLEETLDQLRRLATRS